MGLFLLLFFLFPAIGAIVALVVLIALLAQDRRAAPWAGAAVAACVVAALVATPYVVVVAARAGAAATAGPAESMADSIESLEVDVQAGSTLSIMLGSSDDLDLRLDGGAEDIDIDVSVRPEGIELEITAAASATPGPRAVPIAISGVDGSEIGTTLRFTVLDGPTESASPTASTSPALIDDVLTLDDVRAGELLIDGAVLEGQSSASEVTVRVVSGDLVLFERVVPVAVGRYGVIVELDDPCCTEVVVLIEDDRGQALSLPMVLPESS